MKLVQKTLTLTTHATTYSIVIPGNATNLKFQNREGTEILQYSLDNFTTFFTVPKPASGAAANNSGVVSYPGLRVSPAGMTLYFQTPTNDGKIVEIEYAVDQ